MYDYFCLGSIAFEGDWLEGKATATVNAARRKKKPKTTLGENVKPRQSQGGTKRTAWRHTEGFPLRVNVTKKTSRDREAGRGSAVEGTQQEGRGKKERREGRGGALTLCSGTGFPSLVGSSSVTDFIRSKTFIPFSISPNTTCFPSK